MIASTSRLLPRLGGLQVLTPDGEAETSGKSAVQNLQTIEDTSESEDEDETGFGFEDVDLELPSTSKPSPANQGDGVIADISILVDSTTSPRPRSVVRRKPASVAEKALRLFVHKAHILCLLGHCIYINSWCNNEVVQRHFASLTIEEDDFVSEPKGRRVTIPAPSLVVGWPAASL